MLNKSMVKRISVVVFIILLSFSMFACNSNEKTESTDVVTTVPPLDSIAVLSMELDENTTKAYEGFVSALSASGYVDANNINLIHTECKAEEELADAANALVKGSPKLIYAIGVDAAIAAKMATTDIPIVFSCVNDPIGAGIVESCEKPEANVTGVCDYSPVFEQIELLATLYPDTQRIGCVYNGADEDAIFSANLASAEAQNRSIKFTQYPCLTEKEYYTELDKALEKCDVLYLTDDALVKSALTKTLKLAKEKGIPVFAESTELVESGCLATCINDYEHIGYSAGELSVILLRSLKPVSDVPVEYSTQCTIVINSDALKSNELELTEDIESSAVFVKSS